ncbi:MAG: outer membrane PBP1 activator LpoA protein [Enterobacterales bacterium]|jgi:outer membrane PBP1 activator LpoA protein
MVLVVYWSLSDVRYSLISVLASSFVNRIKNITVSVLLCALFMALTGCGSTSSISNQSSSADKAQYYLGQAQNSSGEKQANWLLLASEALLAQKRTDKALNILNSVNRNTLNITGLQLHHLLTAQALVLANREQQALAQYNQIKEPTLLKTYQQINFHRDYANLLDSLSRFYEGSLQRIALSGFLKDELEIEENNELLWQSLMLVSNINIYRNSLNSMLVSGWLELASLAKNYAEQPDILVANLEQWRTIYKEHPANKQLPIDMARAEAARSYRPDVIALLLPESGSLASSAKQIRDGFLAAVYNIPAEQRPEILFYDSSQTSNIQLLYQKAVDQGATFVIGPLRRESVNELAKLEVFPVPVMTINRLDDDLFLPKNFYQFGLPVEDEARQAAIKAWEDGLSRAIVLVPSGVIGERTSKAFSEQFERLGGETQQIINYGDDNDYARAVQELLGVDKSLARHSRLQQLMAIPLKYESRRRQDSDFLFFKASVNQARRIKPFIDFYYAHDLALYSTSSIYNGKDEPQLDNDLNKVLFCDIPWLLSDEYAINSTKNRISELWPNSTKTSSARLFALGHDLFTLIPDLSKLRNFPQFQIQGLSGTLSVDQLGHIQRTLSWAKFENGKAILLSKNQGSKDQETIND